MKTISIVVPVHNEEGNIELLVRTLQSVIAPLMYTFELIFVDDGSSDRSLSIIQHLASVYPNVFFIKLARNYGHQNAIKAGLDKATGDCVITMDGDMQHPPALLPVMIEKWEEGYDIVYTRRKETADVGWFKKKTSKWFYKLMSLLTDVKLEEGTADFRLLDTKVADIIRNTKSAELFLRGLVKVTGFQQYALDYKAETRFSGKSKFGVRKMFRFALQGVTAFTNKPLHIAAYLGLIFSFSAILYVPYILISLFFGHAVSGWSSIIATIVFFGGLQLFVLGIIGIYIGKIFAQVKHDHHYIIRESNLYETNTVDKL